MTLKELQELFAAQDDDADLDKTCEILDNHYQRVLEQLALLKRTNVTSSARSDFIMTFEPPRRTIQRCRIGTTIGIATFNLVDFL